MNAIKVNKIGMAFVLVIFLFSILLVLQVGFVSSEIDSRSMTLSSATSNPKYYSSQGYTSYSRRYASTYWPALNDASKCEATSDFLINLRPASCSPTVVRSDLLSEQNIAVFCKVDIIKLNPLIDVTNLKSVKFKGKLPEGVAGINFHPNKEAIYAQRQYIENPLINDAGYVVVVLKRTPREEDMPDEIKMNITGVLTYDSENFFGTGTNHFYLEMKDDKEWANGDNYKEDSFFQGKGYLRADWVDADKAGVSIYLDQDERYASFTLEKGKTSELVYMPGFYCRAGVKLKLDSIEAGVKKVQLNVEDKNIWLVEKEKFLDNKCQVLSISITEDKKTNKEKRSVRINCRGKTSTLYYYTDLSSGEEEEEEVEETGEKTKIKHLEKGDIIDYDGEMYDVDEVLLDGDNITLNLVPSVEIVGELVSIEKNKETTLSSLKIELIAEDGPFSGVEEVEKEVDEFIEENYEKAKERAEEIGNVYGEITSEAGEIWGAKALYQLAILAEKLDKKDEAKQIYNKILNEYPDTPYSRSAETKLENVEKPEISYNFNTIKLIKIEKPTREEASADFTVWKLDEDNQKSSQIDTEKTKQRMQNEYFARNVLKVKKISSESVSVYYYYEQNGKRYRRNLPLLKIGDTETFQVKKDGQKYAIRLDNINLKPVAKVSLIADAPDTFSEADFTFAIGIEKRAIQLSPNKTLEKIQDLNETIEKWEGTVESLGGLVETLKGACLAVSAILTAKNFLSNTGGGAIARQEVMKGYNQKCKEETGKTSGNEFTKCLDKYSKQIEDDIKVEQDSIRYVNDREVIPTQKENRDEKTGRVDRDKSSEKFIEYLPRGGVTYTRRVLDEDTGKLVNQQAEISAEDYEKLSFSDIIELRTRQRILQDERTSDVLREQTNREIEAIANRLENKQEEVSGGLYEQDSLNWLNLFKIEFNSKQLARTIPVPKTYTSVEGNKVGGFYIQLEENEYTSGADINRFRIKNIGKDGKLDDFDDPTLLIVDMDLYKVHLDDSEFKIANLNKQSSKQLLNDAIQAVKQANTQYGKDKVNIFGYNVPVDKIASTSSGADCRQFMSANDCKILFNVCDPVICPSSRCDLGGTYRVDNVIQSGIVGSIFLCLPNSIAFGGDVIIPVCLTGIHAGLDNFVQVLKMYRDCLQHHLETGELIGVCDSWYSVYLCDFFWGQITPVLEMLLPRLIQGLYGQGMKGGGEYLTVQAAWNHAQDTVGYLKNHYAVNSYKAFQGRISGEIGTEFCKSFISQRYPSSKDFFDNLLQPDSPVQINAWFDEMEYTDATVPATSHYKVSFMIYAGKDESINYQVYLRNPPTSAYVTVQERVIVDTGFIGRGESANKAIDHTWPSGYKEICVRINGKDYCGFKKVTTSFGLNYLRDKYYEEQLKETDISSTKECVSGKASVLGLTESFNVQSSVEGVSPIGSQNLEKKGVVRVCSLNNPGGEANPRWKEVGECDEENVKCWIDMDSVEEVIQSKDIESSTKAKISNEIDKPEFMKPKELDSILGRANKALSKMEDYLTSKTKTLSSRRSFLKEVAGSIENGGTVTEIGEDMKKLFAALDSVEERASVTNKKAEAGFYKFKFYEFITKYSLDSEFVVQEEALESEQDLQIEDQGWNDMIKDMEESEKQDIMNLLNHLTINTKISIAGEEYTVLETVDLNEHVDFDNSNVVLTLADEFEEEIIKEYSFEQLLNDFAIEEYANEDEIEEQVEETEDAEPEKTIPTKVDELIKDMIVREVVYNIEDGSIIASEKFKIIEKIDVADTDSFVFSFKSLETSKTKAKRYAKGASLFDSNLQYYEEDQEIEE